MISKAIIKDRINRLRPLTRLRLLNIIRLIHGFRNKAMHSKAMPMSISFEPTTSCNLRCPECMSGLRSFTRPTGMANLKTLERLLSQLKPWLVYVNLYFQGEPYLNLEMDEMVKACKNAGVYSSTSTNAHYLTPDRAETLVKSKLDRLIISIDGVTQKSYSSYRVGGLLSKVLEGTANVIEAKKSAKTNVPHVVWQFLVVGHNEDEVEKVKSLAKEYGVDEVVVKTAQIDQPIDGHPLLTKNPKLRRYDRDNISGKWTLRNPMSNHCWRMWQSCVISWDGRIVPCCFDKDADHEMGRVDDGGFRDVWHGGEYHELRRKIFANRAGIKMCTNCSEGTETYA